MKIGFDPAGAAIDNLNKIKGTVLFIDKGQ